MLIIGWYLLTLLSQKDRYQLSLVVFILNIFKFVWPGTVFYRKTIYPLRIIAKLRTEKS